MAKQQKVIIKVPKQMTPSDRIAFAQDVMDFIRNRAENNTGFNPSTGRNKKFPRYTKNYAERKGVSRGDVDLELSGEMLDAMKLLSHRSGSVSIGYAAGTNENAKAEGNQIGSYGGAPNRSRARPFLGITQTDAKRLQILSAAGELEDE